MIIKCNKLFLLFVDRLLTLFLVLFCLGIVWFLLQITTFTTFRIPSDSMEPSLMAGDNILVNKCVMGGRIFSLTDALDKKEVNISRLPGWGKIKRNDVLVFNFPYPAEWDSIGFDVMNYYVKRCIALPGDTLEIRNGYYKVKGIKEAIGNVVAQKRISLLKQDATQNIVMETYPWKKSLGWTIQEFGPLSVPARGQEIVMDSLALMLYRPLIEWELKERLFQKGDMICLGDSIVFKYRFTENYYFVSGDKMENSKDSRYWGLLPESYIVGKATLIWKSINLYTDKVCWDRVLKKIE